MPNVPWVPCHELGSLSHWSAVFVSSLPSKHLDGKKIILLSILYKYNTHGGDFKYYPKERPTSLLYSEKETAGCNSCWTQTRLFTLLCFFFKRHFVSTQHKTNNLQAEPEKQSWLFGRHLRLRLRWGGYESSRSVDEGPSRAVVSWKCFSQEDWANSLILTAGGRRLPSQGPRWHRTVLSQPFRKDLCFALIPTAWFPTLILVSERGCGFVF